MNMGGGNRDRRVTWGQGGVFTVSMAGSRRMGIVPGGQEGVNPENKGDITEARRVIRMEGYMREWSLGRKAWLSGSLGLRPRGAVGHRRRSTHWLGLAPKVSKSCTAELWPSSAERKSPVCPAEFSPSTWTTEGQQGSGLSLPFTPEAEVLGGPLCNTSANSQSLQSLLAWGSLDSMFSQYTLEAPPSNHRGLCSRSVSTRCSLLMSPKESQQGVTTTCYADTHLLPQKCQKSHKVPQRPGGRGLLRTSADRSLVHRPGQAASTQLYCSVCTQVPCGQHPILQEKQAPGWLSR